MITTIEELRQHKRKLWEQLDKAFQDFEENTGLGFESVSIAYLQCSSDYIRRARISEIKVIIV